jgi:hypothetical protein
MPLILVAYRPENKLTRRKDKIAMHAKPWPLLSMPNASKMESGERKTKHHSYPTQVPPGHIATLKPWIAGRGCLWRCNFTFTRSTVEYEGSRRSSQYEVLICGVYQAVRITIKMSDSEGSNFSDNESERGSNQQSDSDVEVTELVHLKELRVRCII